MTGGAAGSSGSTRPDKQDAATTTVLQQAELLSAFWTEPAHTVPEPAHEVLMRTWSNTGRALAIALLRHHTNAVALYPLGKTVDRKNYVIGYGEHSPGGYGTVAALVIEIVMTADSFS